ncbi:MAG: DUF512 domain-containing protein [Clostridiaceae bacterium]|nr:DUF512 domain-containing protein [Clostridiaceae bacterium]
MKRGNEKSRTIASVACGSVAERLGITPGDILLSVDGAEVADVFDFRMRELSQQLTIEIRHADGTIETRTVEKDEYEDLGLSFYEPLMDRPRACSNRCVFCFIDQLPKGMRPTLYFKDDDPRLCFLNGNFVTLTNIDDNEYARILSYRMSPLNVSVHSTDPELRVRMTGNPCAGNIMERLRQAAEAGIEINCQIVLCPGINDGTALSRTVSDLVGLGEALLSIAVVPVGLTRFREENGLAGLSPYDAESAGTVLDYVHRRQSEFQKKYGRRILYAADELYIRAEQSIPPASRYDDFHQLENGVGLLALRRREFRDEISRLSRSRPFRRDFPSGLTGADRYRVISGTDAAPFLADELRRAKSVLGTVPEVISVPNRFFGERVTVTGLLTGSDILDAIERLSADRGVRAVLIPDVTLRAAEDVFLDNMTVGELTERCEIPVVICETNGRGLIRALIELEKTDPGGIFGDLTKGDN